MSKDYPSGEGVVITESFPDSTRARLEANVNSSKRRGFNEQLPPEPRGVFIGGDRNTTYDMWVEQSDGSIVPYLELAPGIVHPIFPARIRNGGDYPTDAVGIVVIY